MHKMKLTTMFKNPHIRFKTMGEMVAEYGINWMDNIVGFEPAQALHIMALFQGKVFYPSLINISQGDWFYYGPTREYAHINMITTKQVPKYDAHGNTIKPGMIVRIDYLAINSNENHMVSANFRNIPGTLVKVLKVFNPSAYIATTYFTANWEKVDKLCIATELRDSFSGAELCEIKMMYSHIFKNKSVCAFEVMHKTSIATQQEKELYYKTIQQYGTESKTIQEK